MTLTQVDANVTGTLERIASFVISDKGPVSGNVSGSTFNFTAEMVTEWRPRFPGDENNICHVQVSTFSGSLTVSGDTMAGWVQVGNNACNPRGVGTGNTTWTRQRT